MNIIFELLFRAWCHHHSNFQVPDALKGDPTAAYGLYTFQEGFTLALSLAFFSLDKREWNLE